MIWLVRQYWPNLPGGTDEPLDDAGRIEARDPEEAAAEFMEGIQKTGDLNEWIGDGNDVDLLVRGEKDSTDHLVRVTVDWSPDFNATALPPHTAIDLGVPSCPNTRCSHPVTMHGPEGCGVLWCQCTKHTFPEVVNG